MKMIHAMVTAYPVRFSLILISLTLASFAQIKGAEKTKYDSDYFRKYTRIVEKEKRVLMNEANKGGADSIYLFGLSYLEDFVTGTFYPRNQAEMAELKEMTGVDANEYCQKENGLMAVSLLTKAANLGHEDAAQILAGLYYGCPEKSWRPASKVRDYNSSILGAGRSTIDDFGTMLILRCYAKQYPGKRMTINQTLGAFARYCEVINEIYTSALRDGEPMSVRMNWPDLPRKLELYNSFRKVLEINPQSSDAAYILGRIEIEGNSELSSKGSIGSQVIFKTGFDKIISAANQGNATACCYLAFKYNDGHTASLNRNERETRFIEPDWTKSDYWADRANALGSPLSIEQKEYLRRTRDEVVRERDRVQKIEEKTARAEAAEREAYLGMLNKAGGIEKVKQRTENARGAGRTLVFKGLYIGMSIQDALITMKEFMPEAVLSKDSDGYQIAIGRERITYAGPEGFVTKFSFSRAAANKLFVGSEKLKWKEFAKQFVENYRIRVPAVWEQKSRKIYEDRKSGAIYAEYYEYNDPSGYRLRFMNLDEPDENGGSGAMAIGLVTSLLGSALGDNSAFLLLEEAPSETNLKKVFN